MEALLVIAIVTLAVCTTIGIMMYRGVKQSVYDVKVTKQQCIDFLAKAQDSHNSIVEGLSDHSRQLERLKQTVEVIKPRMKA